MKTSAYDEQGARTLLPMLRSIMNEIRERRETIDALELVVLDTATRPRAAREGLIAIGALAEQKRALRMATEELSRFGCALDADHSERIHIPGEAGDISEGFVWDAALETLERRPILAASLSA